MKSFFSLVLLIFNMNSMAGQIFILSPDEKDLWARKLKDRLISKYEVPGSLIKIESSDKCEQKKSFSLTFCLIDENNFELIRNKNRELVLSSLRIFKKRFN